MSLTRVHSSRSSVRFSLSSFTPFQRSSRRSLALLFCSFSLVFGSDFLLFSVRGQSGFLVLLQFPAVFDQPSFQRSTRVCFLVLLQFLAIMKINFVSVSRYDNEIIKSQDEMFALEKCFAN
ncbi:hypothetical protein AVEN_240278-1 [Araneus ventricosus]|uniref:Transmembrane protein n=1 Tax=Araneus ventricosus TaxID=182803 RepID=A0A4Y2NJ94_ARAVE|nr:hypothetical protein AVEN_240278-1 [Araneus ventricosus]